MENSESVSRSVVFDSLWPMDCSPLGSSVYGIFQARILEWVTIPFSRGSSPSSDWTRVSHIAGRFFTGWTTKGKIVGHILLKLIHACMLNCSVVSNSFWLHRLQPARLLCPWGFSSQEYWSALSCPAPGDLPNPGIKPRSSALQMDSLPSELSGKPTEINNPGI